MPESQEVNARVRAPEFRGRGWLNTGGRPLKLEDVRGRIVVLDFWTFCCINCLHVLDELRPLEEKYADVLVVIGVHSPKFEHEKDPVALAAAVERYGVTHPVLDDPTLDMWQQYTAKAWPTLTVIDPEGYVVASMAGEGHAEGLGRLIEQLVGRHERKGTLVRGAGPYVPPEPKPTELRFPGKAVSLGAGELLVADSAHHSIVVYDPNAEKVLKRFGDGERGHVDGPAEQARFNEPGGMCLLPAELRQVTGYDVVVADTVNHLLRGINTETGEVTTVAGSGRPWRSNVDFDPHDARAVDLSSPWDLAWHDDLVIIAMAGIHQLWWFDPVKRTAGVYAGTTVEALKDGPLREAWFAQPSGLSAHDGKLWIADSESSALRYVENGELHTVVGQGLFDFGLVDGPAAEALLQHPLGVLATDDGVYVADTYNGAVRRYRDGRVDTVATGLGEPSDLVDADGTIFVVESSTHRLTAITTGSLRHIDESRMRTERPPTALTTGNIRLDIIFEPAPGQKLDVSYGPATRLEVTASPPELLAEGSGVGEGLSRELVLRPGAGVLQVVAQAATCDAEAEHPACHLTRQDWGVPIVVGESGAQRLPLVLRGLDVSP